MTTAAWTLVLIIYTGSAPVVTTHNFNSLSACQTAQEFIFNSMLKNRMANSYSAKCVSNKK